MGDKVTERGLEERVLGYGDRVVAQGDVPTQSKAAPPATKPAPAPPDVARLILIDRRGLVKDALRKTLAPRLERTLNALSPPGGKADHLLAVLHVKFEVSWLSKMPNAAERAAYGKLDFPLYLDNAHTSDNLTADELQGFMREHGIREAGPAGQTYAEAKAGWESKSVEGLGVPSFAGYRKLGFIKADLIGKTRDPETAYANVARHEFGHMCNIKKHADSGLMRASVPLDTAGVDFSEDNRTFLINDLKRLAQGDAAMLQRAYEMQNR